MHHFKREWCVVGTVLLVVRAGLQAVCVELGQHDRAVSQSRKERAFDQRNALVGQSAADLEREQLPRRACLRRRFP